MDILSIFSVDLPQLISARMKERQDREEDRERLEKERDRHVDVRRQYDSVYRYFCIEVSVHCDLLSDLAINRWSWEVFSDLPEDNIVVMQ